jgi:hypothetical protein
MMGRKLSREDIYEFIRVTYPELSLAKLKVEPKAIQPMAFKPPPHTRDFIKSYDITVLAGESISFEHLKSVASADGTINAVFHPAQPERVIYGFERWSDNEEDYDGGDWPYTTDKDDEVQPAVEEKIVFKYTTGEKDYNAARKEWEAYNTRRLNYNSNISRDQRLVENVSEFNEAQIRLVKLSNPDLWNATARQINLLRNANIKSGE